MHPYLESLASIPLPHLLVFGLVFIFNMLYGIHSYRTNQEIREKNNPMYSNRPDRVKELMLIILVFLFIILIDVIAFALLYKPTL